MQSTRCAPFKTLLGLSIPAVLAFVPLLGCGPTPAPTPEGLPPVVGASSLPVLPPAVAQRGDWPWWRGPSNDGIAPADQDPALTWSDTENVVWVADVPGTGHGSPCIVGERVLVPTADESTETISLRCYNRRTGDLMWETPLSAGSFDHTHEDNSHASGTPACDGERAFFAYQAKGSVFLAATDLDGKILWNKQLAPFVSMHGFACSPLLYKSLVIVPSDNPGPGFLTAVHRVTGDVVWRTRRLDDFQNFSSPIVLDIADRKQLILVGPNRVHSYDPDTGELVWKCDGPTKVAAATAVTDGQNVFATAGYPKRHLMAIRGDGKGEISRTHLLWKTPGGARHVAAYVPTPVLKDGLIYSVNDEGTMRCYDATSGEVIWQHDLGQSFYSSPIIVGDRIYVFSRDGDGYVMRTGREFNLLAENKLPSGVWATPRFLDGRMYVRTLHQLYCIGQ